MSDDEQTETTEKRSPGRPKGSTSKRRSVKREAAHHGPHADTALVDFVYDADLPSSPFDIDSTVLAGIARDYGFVVEWHVQEVGGKIMDRFYHGAGTQSLGTSKEGQFWRRVGSPVRPRRLHPPRWAVVRGSANSDL